MNIDKFFRDVVQQFNDTNKCGRCWAFFSPLSESGMNATKLEDDEVCCTKIFMTYYKYSSGYARNQNTGLQKTGFCDYIFTLYVVEETELGQNVDKEQPGHDIMESLKNKILIPLEECLGCGNEFDLCELDYDFDIFKWDMEAVILKGDNNYTGWKVNAIFREYR